jgi:hypothetical protein
MRRFLYLFPGLLLATVVHAAPKPHVIAFGKWQTVKWFVGVDENQALDLKVRPLYVDTRVKEFTLGPPHEVTDRLLVVRRAFRLNDKLPDEAAPRWRWQRGGWLLVDRVTGRVTQLNLPEFDPGQSAAGWYRDYIAYCGVSDDGKKLYAIVAQLGRRKPILRQPLGEPGTDGEPDCECAVPAWQRQPPRVTFEPEAGQKLTFTVRGRIVDLVSAEEETAEGPE